ncbi:MAG: acyltransferase [Alicyclobacillus herbarius]|uniref:acyltransferase family protein n=1 Tax=Alicyclobacillus herbarius TaxID=122960 RepID=UPI0023524140|nr:acyltransferase [Alicyclobacillus herbarius]MCL6631389.1 acyltransferase [Alicyclobacillus herbarius]
MKRIAVLDALRGLAALTVVFEHCLISLPAFNQANGYRDPGKPWVDALTFTPLHLAWAGHEAVIFFFVLSGFVLALPFLNNKSLPYTGYLMKRICRLYIPYVVVVLLSAGLLTCVFADGPVHGQEENMSSWFQGIWNHAVTPSVVAQYILMTGQDTHNLDVSSWSLVHELRISLIFPVLVVLLRRIPTQVSVPCAAGLILSMSAWYNAFPYRLGATLYYVGFFALGVLLAKHRLTIRAIMECFSRSTKVVLLVLALLLYNADWFPAIHSFFDQRRPGIDIIIAVAAALIIALSLGSARMKAWLGKGPFLWLGHISFSLYLIHPVVLAGLVYGLDGWLPKHWIILLVPPVSILSAYVMYRFVERPSIRLGRQLAQTALEVTKEDRKAA